MYFFLFNLFLLHTVCHFILFNNFPVICMCVSVLFWELARSGTITLTIKKKVPLPPSFLKVGSLLPFSPSFVHCRLKAQRDGDEQRSKAHRCICPLTSTISSSIFQSLFYSLKKKTEIKLNLSITKYGHSAGILVVQLFLFDAKLSLNINKIIQEQPILQRPRYHHFPTL